MRARSVALLALCSAALFGTGRRVSAQARRAPAARVERVRAGNGADPSEHVTQTQTVTVNLEGNGPWPFFLAGRQGEVAHAGVTSGPPSLRVDVGLTMDDVQRNVGLSRTGDGPFGPDGCHGRGPSAREQLCTQHGTVELTSREENPTPAERRHGAVSARISERFLLLGFEREVESGNLRSIELAIVRTRAVALSAL